MPWFQALRANKLIQQIAINLNCGDFQGSAFFKKVNPVLLKGFIKILRVYSNEFKLIHYSMSDSFN